MAIIFPGGDDLEENRERWSELLETFTKDENLLRQGAGPESIEKQHAKNRLTARERIQPPDRSRLKLFRTGDFCRL